MGKQMQEIRIALRGKATVLMGKNTMMRKAIRGYLDKNPDLERLLPHIKQNVGFVFAPEILDITDDDLKKTFMAGVANLAAVCLEIGYPTIASVPHSVVNGMKNLLAIAAVTDITFKEAEMIKEYLADPSKFAAAAAAPAAGDAAPAAAAAAAPAKEESEDEESDDMGMGLFD